MQVWQTFLTLAHVGHSSVFLYRPSGPAFHRNTVNGRSHVLHAPPPGARVMRTYGLGPRHVSHTMGKSSGAPLGAEAITAWRPRARLCGRRAARGTGTGGKGDFAAVPRDVFFFSCARAGPNRMPQVGRYLPLPTRLSQPPHPARRSSRTS
jgi:hypothetical protein